ncbi:ribosomal protein large subunit L28 [Thermoplasma volcanium GSS1]|uniref:Large ribosomal subunit protein uL15 n=1 Tax=Thermoplasma volcanium (strain ATCC 51530 / DSM 4299 / JCM 9571 / NBRC 15438 / GSS1) TaxID=273116 RepID=RL15_THEVO|nr:uL15 family ribosomal protein [Thermoplasma volcanium]Q97BV4.1 RecName: Full=Large ribosomal subunit protein uL15; AltName: Full=50S ribosomal protein L15 [Thermoplasma volcanium GSS1]BAB59493.1 ribosomal protein large subunit L28 [Thermoplasma volcanium GSS1]
MVRERTKKLRGGHYGRGMKAGRGKGKKGGRGNAGMGKHKWIWMVKYDPLHFGGKGFTSHHLSTPDVPINLGELENIFENLKADGFVREENGETVVDLKAAGYDKLLGSGNFSVKSRIIIDKATEKAISKLSAIGSKIENVGNTAE